MYPGASQSQHPKKLQSPFHIPDADVAFLRASMESRTLSLPFQSYGIFRPDLRGIEVPCPESAPRPIGVCCRAMSCDFNY